MNNYFYDTYSGYSKEKHHKISKDSIEKIKKLKLNIENSYYYDNMLIWKYGDNKDLFESEEEFKQLFIDMQFLSMTAIVKKEQIKSIKVEDYHIRLLRRLYLELDSIDGHISTGYKRPFGNSNVLGDVREEIERSLGITIDGDNYEQEEKVLSEFIEFLQEFYKGAFELRYNSFMTSSSSWGEVNLDKSWNYLDYHHSHLYRWEVDKSEIRNEKIEQIIK